MLSIQFNQKLKKSVPVNRMMRCPAERNIVIAGVRDFSRPVGRKIGDPFSNGLIWMIDVSIGLGSGKILAVVAIDAGHHVTNETRPRSSARLLCRSLSGGILDG